MRATGQNVIHNRDDCRVGRCDGLVNLINRDEIRNTWPLFLFVHRRGGLYLPDDLADVDVATCFLRDDLADLDFVAEKRTLDPFNRNKTQALKAFLAKKVGEGSTDAGDKLIISEQEVE